MIDKAYENGQLIALQEIEKVAGYEFAEKVANKFTDAAKSAYGGLKANLKSAKSSEKYENMKGIVNRKGGTYGMGTALNKKERIAEGAKAAGKIGGGLALASGAAYGGKKMYDK